MRVRVDRGAETVHLELSEAAIAQRRDVADGVAIAYDVAGRIVGVGVRGVDPVALAELSIDLTDVQTMGDARPTSAPRPAATVSVPPEPLASTGPVDWDPKAAAAMTHVPFFQRGPMRLAAIALARRRGLSQVTVAVLNDAKAGRVA